MGFLERLLRRKAVGPTPAPQGSGLEPPHRIGTADVARMESERDVAGLVLALRTRTTHVEGGVVTGQAARDLAASMNVVVPPGKPVNVFNLGSMNVIDDTVSIRHQAALALGRVRDPASHEALIEALGDSVQDVSQAARTALCQIGGPEVEAELQRFQPHGFGAFETKVRLRELLNRR